MRVVPVTHDNSSLVEWSSEYSACGSRTAIVVEDSRWKKRDGLEDLACVLEGANSGHNTEQKARGNEQKVRGNEQKVRGNEQKVAV
jgi:hypothetical protein